MPAALYNIENLKQLINQNALILVPNNWLARNINNAWAEHCKVEGKKTWAAPRVMVLHSWLDEAWQQLADTGFEPVLKGRLITPYQEQYLWQKVISEDENFYPLTLAKMAQRAFDIYQQWQLSEQDLTFTDTPFKRWAKQFRQYLQAHQLITQANLTLLLIEAIAAKQLTQEPVLAYTGFETLSPLQLKLFNALSTRPVAVESARFNSPQSNLVLPCLDFEQELTHAARWADQLVKKHSEQQPLRIGIVVPQLASNFLQVHRIFKQQCSAGSFTLHASQSLGSSPVIRSAVNLLGLNKESAPLDSFTQMLRSPFWDGGCSDTNRLTLIKSHCEFLLTESRRPNITTSQFRFTLHQTEQQLPEDEATLSPALEQAQTLRKQQPTRQLFSTWINLFEEQLNQFGWPGQRALNTREQQQLSHWQQLLTEALQLDALLGEINLSNALSQIQSLVQNTRYKEDIQANTIQVFGLLESAALSFDYLWVMDMSEQSWPAPCQPNPLLPVQLQQQRQMPRASPQQELQLAQKLLRSFSCNAQQVIFSYPQFDGETEQQPSPLIANFQPFNMNDQTQPVDTAQPNLTETIDDSLGQPLFVGEEPVTGGTSLFSDQATCPFNSYVKHRLGAFPLKQPSLGLTPMDRGIILHHCLELFWQAVQNSENLNNLSETALTDQLKKAITGSLRKWLKERSDIFGQHFLAIEIQRLQTLLMQWLAIEKDRPPFSVIATEQQLITRFAGIPLRLRIDRIDQVNSQQLLIDYKTGAASISAWLGDRPNQPQLPLYALCSSTPPSAITFATINAATQGFAGVSLSDEQAMALPDLTQPGKNGFAESSQGIIDNWQQALEHLAEELKTGFAEVRFENTTAANRNTDLWCLNRWPETQRATAISNSQAVSND